MVSKTVHALQDSKIHVSEKKVTAYKAESVIPAGYRHATVSDAILQYAGDFGFRLSLKRIGALWIASEVYVKNGYYALGGNKKLSRVDEDTFYSEVPFEKRVHIHVPEYPETLLCVRHMPIFEVRKEGGFAESGFLMVFSPEKSKYMLESIAYVDKNMKEESVFGPFASEARR